MLAIILLLLRRRAPQRLTAVAALTGKIRSDNYLHTADALVQTLILAGSGPLITAAIGWSLMTLADIHPYSVAVGNGLLFAAAAWFITALFAHIVRTDGLGERHFRWSPVIIAALKRELLWFGIAAPLLVFVIIVTQQAGEPQAVPGLGRPAFLALCATLVLLVHRLFRRGGKVCGYLYKAYPDGWLVRLHLVWYLLLIGAPLALAVASLAGFHYTALTFAKNLYKTAWVILGLLIVKDLLLRWFTMTERRLRYEEALKRREEVRAQREKGATEEAEGGTPAIEVAEIDYDHLGEQAKRLMRTALLLGGLAGVWLTWADLLPVLSFVDDVNLPFTTIEMVDGVEKEVPVTLANLGVTIIFVVITVIAAKNLPGLLEITLLQRLPLDAGGRYAITTLSQYLIVAIGTISAFSSLGMQWSKLQWLVAALGVGLGFGLQEIVANFVSGIILLFERPIRVGDMIRVGDITGKVSRIRIRATTILNWDRQELVIPNKEFITGQVLNWTLSDQINRIVITVGIAYGSDVTKALELLIAAAREHPRVIADPAPKVSFEGFGDNALTLVLRSYLDSLEFRLETISELHQAVNRKFNEAGIVIAFPQRDLHLDTQSPLEIRIVNPGSEAP